MLGEKRIQLKLRNTDSHAQHQHAHANVAPRLQQPARSKLFTVGVNQRLTETFKI